MSESTDTGPEPRTDEDVSADQKPDALAALTAFQRDCLWALSHTGPTHGLGLKEELEAYRPEEINHGRLYPNLDTLVEDGFLEKEQKDRRTNEYSLTEKARRGLSRRQEWEDDG